MPTNGAIVSLLSFPTKGPQRCSARRERKRGEERRREAAKDMGIFWILSGHVDIRYVIPFQGLPKTATAAPCRVFTVFKGKDKEKAPIHTYTHTHTRLMSIFKGIRIKKKHKGIPTTMMMMMTATTRDTEARKRARCNRNGNHPLLQKAEAAATKPRNQEKSSTERNSKTSL